MSTMLQKRVAGKVLTTMPFLLLTTGPPYQLMPYPVFAGAVF